jgi:hypothetical protein
MRIVAVIACLLVTSSLAFVAFASRSTDTDWHAKQNPLFSDILETRDSSLLDDFMATLDRAIIKECVAQHDADGEIDLDRLATCGDFDIYARYMRISKFDAVKKFRYVLLHSSSKLEFDDRLAR